MTDVFESPGSEHFGVIAVAPSTTTTTAVKVKGNNNSAIAEPSLSLAAALEKFADAAFSTRGKDFSDSIAAPSPQPPRTGESRAARLHRLKAEVAALMTSSSDADGGDDENDASLADDVRSLAATLEQLSVRAAKPLPTTKTTTVATAAAVVGGSTPVGDVALERRVAALEAALGLNKNVVAHADLADAVSLLEQRLRDVLDFDATAARVRTLTADIDALTAKAAAAAAGAGAVIADDNDGGAAGAAAAAAAGEPLLVLRAQVVEAHALLQQVAPVAQTLPAIAERLRALRSLHTAALDAAGFAARVEGAQSEVRAQLAANAELLAALQQSSSASAKAAQDNVAALQKRLDALNKK